MFSVFYVIIKAFVKGLCSSQELLPIFSDPFFYYCPLDIFKIFEELGVESILVRAGNPEQTQKIML